MPETSTFTDYREMKSKIHSQILRRSISRVLTNCRKTSHEAVLEKLFVNFFTGTARRSP